MSDKYVKLDDLHPIYELNIAWEYGQGVKDCIDIIENAPTVELPPWHDLKENPEDLPLDSRCVLVYDSEYGYQVARYLIRYGYAAHWFNGRNEVLEMVARWMELPKDED